MPGVQGGVEMLDVIYIIIHHSILEMEGTSKIIHSSLLPKKQPMKESPPPSRALPFLVKLFLMSSISS